MNLLNSLINVKKNKKKIIKQKNNLIDKLINIKKKNSDKEEWLKCREEWNEKRNETIVEKMHRETKEMLEEIKEEKVIMNEMRKKMIDKEKELNELIKKSKVLEMKNELNGKIETVQNNLNILQNKHDELKNDFIYSTIENIRNLSITEMIQLEEWTGKKCGEILFDSDKDDWSNNKIFNQRLINKCNILFLIEDTNGNKFGGYLNETITKYGNTWNENIPDSNAFVFSLKSKGRINGMMKFENKNTNYSFLLFNNDSYLMEFGTGHDIFLCNKRNKEQSHCKQSSIYEYHGIIQTLSDNDNFTPKRFVVIQMK